MTEVGKSCPIERERDLAHWVLKLTVSQAAIPTYGRFLRQFGRATDMSGVAHEKNGSMSECGIGRVKTPFPGKSVRSQDRFGLRPRSQPSAAWSRRCS